jgi:hypothetical protein
MFLFVCNDTIELLHLYLAFTVTPYPHFQLHTESAPAPAAEKVPKGPLDMATEESEKKIADAEEEEDKTPPRTLQSAYNFITSHSPNNLFNNHIYKLI